MSEDPFDSAGVPPAPPRESDNAGRRGRANVAAVEGCYQLGKWLIPVLDGLPRRQKFQLGDRLQTTALDALDLLIEAAYTRERAELLRRANLGLGKLRFWVRLAHDFELMDFRRYEHTARLIDEVGREVGSWYRAERGHRKTTSQLRKVGDDAPPAH